MSLAVANVFFWVEITVCYPLSSALAGHRIAHSPGKLPFSFRDSQKTFSLIGVPLGLHGFV
jgi:hypothetical protein